MMNQAFDVDTLGSELHTVQQGECVFSIASEHGILWNTLWNLPANAQLRDLRKEPGLLLPGDQITVPEREAGAAFGGTAARHTFKVADDRVKLRLIVEHEDMPIANAAYKLVVDGTAYQGKTDMDGLLEASVLPRAAQGQLAIQDVCFALHLGTLDPNSEDIGIQQRLANLDFYRGALDGTMGPTTREAVADFQARAGLEVTGDLDDNTRQNLLHRHDESHERLPSRPGQDTSTPANEPADIVHRHICRLHPDSNGVVTLNTRDSQFVYARFEWPVYIVDRLPDDFTLTLSGPEILEQSKTRANSSQQDDLVQFEFEWRDKTRSVKLTASGGGKTIDLWQEQVAGDLSTLIDWNERIHPLLAEPEDVYLPTEGTSPGDMPDDLRYEEVDDLDRADAEAPA